MSRLRVWRLAHKCSFPLADTLYPDCSSMAFPSPSRASLLPSTSVKLQLEIFSCVWPAGAQSGVAAGAYAFRPTRVRMRRGESASRGGAGLSEDVSWELMSSRDSIAEQFTSAVLEELKELYSFSILSLSSTHIHYCPFHPQFPKTWEENVNSSEPSMVVFQKLWIKAVCVWNTAWSRWLPKRARLLRAKLKDHGQRHRCVRLMLLSCCAYFHFIPHMRAWLEASYLPFRTVFRLTEYGMWIHCSNPEGIVCPLILKSFWNLQERPWFA